MALSGDAAARKRQLANLRSWRKGRSGNAAGRPSRDAYWRSLMRQMRAGRSPAELARQVLRDAERGKALAWEVVMRAMSAPD